MITFRAGAADLHSVPDGRFVPRWTRPVTIVFGAWTLAYTLFPNFGLINPKNWPEFLSFFVV